MRVILNGTKLQGSPVFFFICCCLWIYKIFCFHSKIVFPFTFPRKVHQVLFSYSEKNHEDIMMRKKVNFVVLFLWFNWIHMELFYMFNTIKWNKSILIKVLFLGFYWGWMKLPITGFWKDIFFNFKFLILI